MRAYIIAVLGLLVGCSSSNGGNTVTGQIDSCVTPGASYVVNYQEQGGGDCGPLPSGVLNTDPNGTVTVRGFQNPSCIRDDGCHVYLTGCMFSAQDVTITETGEMTWAADGSGGSGTFSILGSAPQGSCSETYLVTAVRQ